MTASLLELSGVVKDYQGLRPLRIEHLAVHEGDQIAVDGIDQPAPEVLINLLTGAMLPDRGDIQVFGRPTASIQNGDEWLVLVDRFGIVSERAVLLEALSVVQNVAVPLSLDPAVVLLEHPTVAVARGDVAPLGRDIRSVIERRATAAVTLTADSEFARAVASRVLTLNPATGRLKPRRRWF